jgi:phenazine biosynthesis protein phzE
VTAIQSEEILPGDRRAAPVSDLLRRILAPEPPPFALIYRPESRPGTLQLLLGDVTEHESLADVPLAASHEPGSRDDVLIVVPYRQIAERGFAASDDGTPLIAMAVTEHDTMPLSGALACFPEVPTALTGGHFDVDDTDYARVVRQIIADEIGAGAGANFVVKRSFVADISDYTPHRALSFFRRLLEREERTYWTFIIHTGRTTLVGATPERHVSLNGGTAVMNPISGTYRYPAAGPTLQGIIEFLGDGKETDELYMVLDEGLKMMARICDGEVTISGPFLKEMAWLAHTGYQIQGKTGRDVREILRETMFAATVTGSPLESAARVISRYEPEGRGYYSGVAALIGHDERGERTLDSAILIRTADIDPAGRLRIAAGATLVRHSDPHAEAAETRAKMAGLLNALECGKRAPYAEHPAVRAALKRRNEGIADFWIGPAGARGPAASQLEGVTAMIVDAEDTFTAMLQKQLQSLGLAVTVRRFDEQPDLDEADLLVMGPGPGDPRAGSDDKMAFMRSVIGDALTARRPMLALCLSHQLLSMRLGFDLRRRKVPNQGIQRRIDLFGASEHVGFYNTFAAYSPVDRQMVEPVGMVEVSRDKETGEVHALRGPRFTSMQFHAESVLTVDGPRIISDAIRAVLPGPGTATR